MSNLFPHLLNEVCSPVHQCFPPLPTVCFICGATDTSECPLRHNDEEAVDGSYRNLRGDTVRDGDVIT